MSKPIRVEDAARDELRAVVAWYEERQPGLGGEFFAEVERTLELIERHPGLGASVPGVPTERGTRRLPLRRFPYTVVYREGEIEIRLSPSRIIAASQDTGPLDDATRVFQPKLSIRHRKDSRPFSLSVCL